MIDGSNCDRKSVSLLSAKNALSRAPAATNRFGEGYCWAQHVFVLTDEIDWIEAAGDYATLHVGKKAS